MNRFYANFKALLRPLWAVCFTLLIAGTASANQYGVRTITSNTTLTDNQYGAIIFGANNITLDCAGYQVHIASQSTNNCNGSKCGIVANGRSNITIRNCHVVGGFAWGIWLRNTSNSSVLYSDSNATTGFYFENNNNLTGYSLDANYCALGGYELRNNTNTKIGYSWATGCGGDGFDENNGTNTTYNQDTRATNNGVNGLECDGCTKILYGSFAPGSGMVLSSTGNGQNGLSGDVSQSIWVAHAQVLYNEEDGIRFQDVSNFPGALITEVVDSYAYGNDDCDALSENSPGDWWNLYDPFLTTWCGNFQD